MYRAIIHIASNAVRFIKYIYFIHIYIQTEFLWKSLKHLNVIAHFRSVGIHREIDDMTMF